MKNYYINIVEGTNQEDLYSLVSSVVNEYSSYPTFFLAECTDEQVLELSNRSEVRLIESLEDIQAAEGDDATRPMIIGRTSKSHALTTYVGEGNWGLIRHTNDANPFAAEDVAYNKTYTSNYDGTGVDFVANLAGMVDVNNAEYKTNGVSRIQQFQWNTLTGMGHLGTIDYATGAQSNHGKAVLAVACSNSCGWATGSNIYILPRNQISSSVDYYEAIQKFHEQKGNSRPTIMVASYSTQGTSGGGYVRNITFRGITDAQPHGLHPKKRASMNAAMSVGLPLSHKVFYAEAANEKTAIATAVQSMTDAGVIAVNSAGNYAQKCDHPNGSDWNNSFVNENNNVRYYYNRGAQEWSNDSIVVANLASDFDTFGNNLEELSISSNKGPRCDTAAAGLVKLTAGLVSSDTYTTNGTSFSAPNVAGMAALVLEKYPTTTPYQMRRFFRETAVSSASIYEGKTTLTTGLGNYGDPEYFNDALSLQGFSGNIAYLDPTLPDDPTALFPTSGSYTYPAEVTENQGINFTTAQINTKLASI